MKKVVVISGGSDGLGREIAQKLASDYSVILLAHDSVKLKQTAKELGCDFLVCDISSEKEIESAVSAIEKKYQRIDCLINNAGLWIEGGIDQSDAEKIKEVIAVNTTGTILLTQKVVPIMKKQKNGFIINVVSQAGLYAKADRSVYTASKWAITGFTKSIQEELSKYHIRVTGLYLGKMKTKMFEKMGLKKDMNNALDTKEVAATVAFLLSTGEEVVFPEIGIKHIDN